ncbi:MAG: PrsW family intramembrane metalloprotease [Aeromicrobium sp.]
MTAAVDRAPVDDLKARRREALKVTGWGAPFHFVQPRNACFWLYLLMVLAGTRTLVGMVSPNVGIFSDAYVAALVTAGAFGLVFVLVLRHIDRWERTPAKLALVAFIGGGFAAPWAIALPGNGAMMGLYAKNFGQAFAEDWQAGLSAPFVEETGKAAIFLLLLGLAPRTIRTVYDGLIVGAFVGLGFQVLEDMLYGQNSAMEHFGQDQAGSVLHTFVLRSATGVASHALYTAVVSAGLIYVIGTVAQPRKLGRGILLIIAAMIMHGLWDSMAALSGGKAALIFAIIAVFTIIPIIVLIIAVRLGANQERHYAHDVLAPEVANGTISEAELDAATGDRRRRRKDRRAALKARPGGTSRRREKHVLRAILDLCNDLAVSGGEDSRDVEHSRAEILRLRRSPASGATATR